MFCPSCGSEISVELKYCNRCGANLLTTPAVYAGPPPKSPGLALPTIILGLTITIGIGIVFSSAIELARMQLNWAAITWMVIFGMATLFGCTALLLRFWLKVVSLNRESPQPQIQSRPQVQIPSPPRQQFQPTFEPVPSVTEHTTRTFSHVTARTPMPQPADE
ncbi:MAG TPA: hypothetical protein VGC61_03800 [Pyrinomonadaceae bacterium]|jgi:hypothetical protein